MRTRFLVGVVLLGMLTIPSMGSPIQSNQEGETFLIPESRLIVAVITQADCPVKIEDVVPLMWKGGGVGYSTRVHNQSTKTVVRYDIGLIGRRRTLQTWPVILDTDKWIGPGTVAPLRREDIVGTLESAPEVDLSKRFRSTEDGPEVELVMIIAVHYSDGSSYNAHKSFEELQRHLGKYYR